MACLSWDGMGWRGKGVGRCARCRRARSTSAGSRACSATASSSRTSRYCRVRSRVFVVVWAGDACDAVPRLVCAFFVLGARSTEADYTRGQIDRHCWMGRFFWCFCVCPVVRRTRIFSCAAFTMSCRARPPSCSRPKQGGLVVENWGYTAGLFSPLHPQHFPSSHAMSCSSTAAGGGRRTTGWGTPPSTSPTLSCGNPWTLRG